APVPPDPRAHPGGAGHVRALADDDKAGVRPDREGLEPREARSPRNLGDTAGRKSVDGPRDRLRVLGRRPAAAAHEIHEAVLGERTEEAARVSCLLVV